MRQSLTTVTVAGGRILIRVNAFLPPVLFASVTSGYNGARFIAPTKPRKQRVCQSDLLLFLSSLHICQFVITEGQYVYTLSFKIHLLLSVHVMGILVSSMGLTRNTPTRKLPLRPHLRTRVFSKLPLQPHLPKIKMRTNPQSRPSDPVNCSCIFCTS